MESGSLPGTSNVGHQRSSAVYKNYIFIFGGNSGMIHWIDVTDKPYTQGGRKQKVQNRWYGGLAFAQNMNGYPAFISFGGYIRNNGEFVPSGIGEFLLVDSDNPNDFSQGVMRSSQYKSRYGPAMAQIGDNIVLVNTDTEINGLDILLWNYQDANPEITGTLIKDRREAVPAVVSGRFFSQCGADQKLEFEKTYSECAEAYDTAGFISPKSTNPVKILVDDGTETHCEFENLYKQTEGCPRGWTEKADEENCYKIFTYPLDNNEAATSCYQEGAELLEVQSPAEDNMINEILLGSSEYSTPTHPGFYHIGLYQRQEGNQYYHRSGIRV